MYTNVEGGRERGTILRVGVEARKREKTSTFHVSFTVQTALSNTEKMNYYLEGRRGAVLSKECVISGKGAGGGQCLHELG